MEETFAPFPPQLEIVSRAEQGRVNVAVPIDILFTDINKLLEAKLSGTTFPEDHSGPVAITVQRATLAASGDRLLMSLQVKAKEAKSWFGLRDEADIYVWGRPVLDPFLHMLHIYRVFDLPYQTQIIPLAAILADIGDAWEHEANRRKLVQWYWNGVFGELYGSAVETRIARISWKCRPGSRAAIFPPPSAMRDRSSEDHADAPLGGLQRGQRASHERRCAGFPVGPEVRPLRVLW